MGNLTSASGGETVQGAEQVAREIRKMLDVQGYPGNWNHDPYMHGMFNGLELACAVAEGREPAFRDAPSEWLADRPQIVADEKQAECGANPTATP